MNIPRIAAIALLMLSTIAANDPAPSNSELEAMYDKAYRAFDVADYPQALKALDAIDARKPDLAASQNLRGVIYMRQGLYDKAEAALAESLRLDPKFWNARFNLAEIPFLKKDWAEARRRFQQLLSGNAADLQGEATQLIQYKILLTYLLEGNDTMVDSILAKLQMSPDTPAVHYANAAIALHKQNTTEARKWVSTAEKNFSPQLNKLFGESLFEVGWLQQQPGQQRSALEALAPEERAGGNKAVAQSQFEQAQQAYEQRDFDSATKLAAEADAAQPNQPQILNLRGEILLEQQKFAEAEEFFSRALKIDSKFREAQFNLAEVPFRQKEYEKARERFQALLKQTPGGDKNQAAQLINFKIYMTYLLEGKDSRAQKLMEEFQFSGDTPAHYYAQAAWEFKHGKPDTANDWLASARKIYPAAANAAYGTGFQDLGWVQSSASAASSPSATPAVNAAAVASAQNESPAPAIEPSPIPGIEAKTEANAFVSAQNAQPTPAIAAESTPNPATSAPKENEAAAKSELASNAAPGTPPAAAAPSASPPPSATPTNVPAVAAQAGAAASTPSAENATSGTPVAASPSATAAPVVAAAENASPVPATSLASPRISAEATAAAILAPDTASQYGQPTLGERLDRLTEPRTLLWLALLVGGVALLAWAAIPEIRRRMHASRGGPESPVTGQDLHAHGADEAPMLHRFVGGPRHVSVELKASEPALRRPVIPGAARKLAGGAELEPSPKIEAAQPVSIDLEDSSVGPVIEQPVAEMPADLSVIETEEISSERSNVEEPPSEPAAVDEHESEAAAAQEWESASADVDSQDLSVGIVVEQTSEPSEPVWEEAGASGELEPEIEEEPVLATLHASEEAIIAGEEAEAGEETEAAEEAEAAAVEFVTPEPASELVSSAAPETESPAEGILSEDKTDVAAAEAADMELAPAVEPAPEPVAQGQPVPHLTVVDADEAAPQEEITPPEEEKEISTEAELLGISGAIAGLGALRGAMLSGEAEENFSSKPTTIQTMPETLQTPTAPVIRTPAAASQPSPISSAAHAAAGGMHTAVHITLSCEIASMQLTPTFKMGALQLRPISKVVTMRLASSQQQQNGMNLQVNFEISKVQPAPGSLGQIRLSPSQQQKPASLNSPSFNISGLQVVSGFEAAPLQLTPSQQGQASVHLTAAFQITTVEFSPTFDIAAMILNSSSKTVSVQLPGGAGGLENGPLFEITNVQLTSNGDIGMLQLNPANTRRG